MHRLRSALRSVRSCVTGTASAALLWLAGVPPGVTHDSRMAEDRYRYSGLGAAIAFTATLAFLSASYAFFTIFREPALGAAFGGLWAAGVCNMDRLIVIGLRRRAGKGWWALLKLALPRLALAILVSLSVSKPVEMAMFQRELRAELLEHQQAQAVAARRSVDRRYPEIGRMEAQNAALATALVAKEKEVAALYAEAVGEGDGTAGSHVKKLGPRYHEKMRHFELENAGLTRLRQATERQMAQNDAHINELSRARDAEVARVVTGELDADSFLARYRALERLKGKDAGVVVMDFFLMLLLLVLETGPVAFKVMMPKGPLDELLDAREAELRAELQLRKDAAAETAKERRASLGQVREAAHATLREQGLKLVRDAVDDPRWRAVQGELLTLTIARLRQHSRQLLDEILGGASGGLPEHDVVEAASAMRDEAAREAKAAQAAREHAWETVEEAVGGTRLNRRPQPQA